VAEGEFLSWGPALAPGTLYREMMRINRSSKEFRF